jgi:hypothetical protein
LKPTTPEHVIQDSKLKDMAQGVTLEVKLTKGPSIFFIIITSVQRVLFFTTPSLPLKVYKSSENDDGGRFHEIKYADPGS